MLLFTSTLLHYCRTMHQVYNHKTSKNNVMQATTYFNSLPKLLPDATYANIKFESSRKVKFNVQHNATVDYVLHTQPEMEKHLQGAHLKLKQRKIFGKLCRCHCRQQCKAARSVKNREQEKNSRIGMGLPIGVVSSALTHTTQHNQHGMCMTHRTQCNQHELCMD